MSGAFDAPAANTRDDLARSPLVAALLTQLPVGVAIASRDGRLAYMNEVAAVGDPDVLHWIIARAQLTGEVIREEEVSYRDERDEPRTLCVSATPVGENVVVTFADVTARNHARDWEPLIRSLCRL
jgi:hypothetical protein